MEPQRLLKDGDKVIAAKQKLIVIDATLCLKGWRYKLAFPRKDGKPNMRTSKRYFFENEITKDGD